MDASHVYLAASCSSLADGWREPLKKTVAIAVLASLFLTAAVPAASAAHVVVRGGVWIGGPYWGPYWSPYWYPRYYYPPAVYAPAYTGPVVAQPPTYIQQPPPAIQQAPSQQPTAPSYWYYCEGAQAYYPYVPECPGGWLTVAPPATMEGPR
jgi:hypothetical protein